MQKIVEIRTMKRYLIITVLALIIAGCESNTSSVKSYPEALLDQYNDLERQWQELWSDVEVAQMAYLLAHQRLTDYVAEMTEENRDIYEQYRKAVDKRDYAGAGKCREKLPAEVFEMHISIFGRIQKLYDLQQRAYAILEAQEECKNRMHEYLIAEASRPVINNHYSPPTNNFDPVQYQYDHLDRQRQQNQMYQIQSSLDKIEKNTRKPLYPNDPWNVFP